MTNYSAFPADDLNRDVIRVRHDLGALNNPDTRESLKAHVGRIADLLHRWSNRGY